MGVPEHFEARAVLGGPCVRLEPLFFVLPGLLERLCQALSAASVHAVRIAVHLGLEREGWQIERIRLGRPTAYAKKIDPLIRRRLETLVLSAPVLELVVVVEESSLARPWQPGLQDRTECHEEVQDVVARLTDVLGESAVGVPALVERWRPEGSWQISAVSGLGEPSSEQEVGKKPGDRTRLGKIDPVQLQDRREEISVPPRPLLLLNKPEPVEVRLNAGFPEAIKRFGAWLPLQVLWEPEHLVGEWWARDEGFDREYWVVQLPEGIGWMFCNVSAGWGAGGWFWQGWFD